MHSRSDELVKFAHAQKNFEAANEPKLFQELAGGHNEPLSDRGKFISAVEKFLNLIASRRKDD
jgi:hypothetical protein